MKKIIVVMVIGLASIAYGLTARQKIVAYVEDNPTTTLVDLKAMSVADLQTEIGLTKRDLRGKGKLKKHVIRWFEARARANKIAILQTLIRRDIPQCGDCVVVDKDPEKNIVVLYIDGLPE